MITLRKWGSRFNYPNHDFKDEYLLERDEAEIRCMHLERLVERHGDKEIVTYCVKWRSAWDKNVEKVLGCKSTSHFTESLADAKKFIEDVINAGYDFEYNKIWPKGYGY